MGFIPFTSGERAPNPAAVFEVAVLASAVYKSDTACFTAFANIYGAELLTFIFDPAAFPPGMAIFRKGQDLLFVFSGTTNVPQFIEHCQSVFYTSPDTLTPTTTGVPAQAVGSFLAGLAQRQQAIDAAIGPGPFGTVQITGHSYGGGVGFILARRFATQSPRPARIELMTLGQPRTYDDTMPSASPDVHLKIVAATATSLPVLQDPVPLMPKSAIQLVSFGLITDFLAESPQLNLLQLGRSIFPGPRRPRLIGDGAQRPAQADSI